MIEFIWAYLSNLSNISGFLAIVVGLLMIVLFSGILAVYLDSSGDSAKEFSDRSTKVLKTLVPIEIILLFFTAVPTPKNMTETRFELLKFYLASPENAEKATGEIVRLVKKLEERFLPDKKESK